MKLLNYSCLFGFLFGVCGPLAAETKLPFAAEVAIEDFERYRADIEKKAAEVISKKRAETIARLEAEAAKLSKSSNAAGAAAVLEAVAALKAEAAAEAKVAELAQRRWVPVMEGESLPGSWAFPAEPDGGWKYNDGELTIESMRKYATVLHELPPGDVAVRVEIKLEPKVRGKKENQAGVAFIRGEDDMIGAIAQAPGLLLAYGRTLGEQLIETEKSSACQSKFSEIQVVRSGKRFLVFARGKLIHDCDAKILRGNSSLALLANNARGSFRKVEYRMLDRDDKERLAEGKDVE